MIYRKLPPHPPKMLLRIVTAAGAGILLGISACSSSSTSPPGLGTSPPDDAGDADQGVGIDAGITISPTPDAAGPIGIAVGSVAFPPDAEGTGADTGIMISPEADVPDVEGIIDSGFHGVMVRPDE